MPPKLKESTVTGYCAKVHEPPKGVGGSIVQSIELKRNVSQSPRGNKVYERAIEERQTAPGVSTTRVGTKIYFFENDGNAFNAKMERLNQELSCKCGEMDELDASLAENELRMAKLDAELEQLNIIGDEAIEEAIITESEDLDLLLVPSIQNLIFKIYSESGITIPSDSSDKCKRTANKGHSKGELKEICKQFCKDEFEKLEREKNNQNLQHRAPGGNSPCINLSTASDTSDGGVCPLPNRNRSQPVPAAPQNRQRVATALERCIEDCRRLQGNSPCPTPAPPAAVVQTPAPPPCNESSTTSSDSGSPCLGECDRLYGTPQTPACGNNRPDGPSVQRVAPPVNQQSPSNRNISPQQCHAADPCAQPSANAASRNRSPQRSQERSSGLASCLEDCERKNGQRGRTQCTASSCRQQSPPNRNGSPQRPPTNNRPDCPVRRPSPPPQVRRQSPAPGSEPVRNRSPSPGQDQCVPAPQNACNPPLAPSPVPSACPCNTARMPSTLEDCIRECEKRFAKKQVPKKQITPRPPLFSRLENGQRCFPDLSEIEKKDQTLYMAERDAYVLFRRQNADRGNDCTFFELPNEFEEYFYAYINGNTKINIPICPPTPKKPEKSSSEELIQTFVDLTKIEIDSVFQRNVVDLALDRPDRDPEVIALLMNERIPLWIDSLVMSELVTPYPLHKRLFATDVRHTAPGSMVPRTIPVQALNLMNTHVMEGVEAIIKSNEYMYPTDSIATEEIKEVSVVKPVKEEGEEEEPAPENYKCVIELHPFRVETFFQLRGANIPLWYPGMFTAFPDGTSAIKLVNTPSALINTAWRMCAP